jgi:hypothetical protein
MYVRCLGVADAGGLRREWIRLVGEALRGSEFTVVESLEGSGMKGSKTLMLRVGGSNGGKDAIIVVVGFKVCR